MRNRSMSKRLVRAVKHLGQLATLWLFACLSTQALAQGLPKLEDPSRGQGKGIFATLQNYLYDASVLGGLLISVVCFLAVAWHGVSAFSEAARGKKPWSEFGVIFVIGVVLIVLCIWLVTKAVEIL